MKELSVRNFNIYHRKDGRWEGRIPCGKRNNGKRMFQYFFGKSKEQVLNKMRETRSEEYLSNCGITVQALINELLTLAKHRVKESTLSNYRLKSKKHIIPAFGSIGISGVSSDDIYSFIEEKQNQGLSNRYILDILIVLKSVFKYAVRTYHIYNPMD